MTIKTSPLELLSNFSPLSDWPEYRTVIQYFCIKPSGHWLLPRISCLSAGGSEEQSTSVIVAISALHASIVLVDDLLDNDKRFEAMNPTQGDIANLSMAILSAGLNAVFQSELDLTVQAQIAQQINQAVMATAMGQYKDTHTIISSEADYWGNAQLKSSPFFGAAFAIGALAGGATSEQIEVYKKLGYLYGEMVQINDDLHDCFLVPASRDWFSGQRTLPLLYARTVNHPERRAFEEIRLQVNDPQKLQQAQVILLHSGAVSYCIHCLMQLYEKARGLVTEISPFNPTPLRDVFCDLMAPVFRLINQIQT